MRRLMVLLGFGALFGSIRAAERDIVRSFPVQPNCSIAIDTYRGAIIVQEADTSEVRVAVHLEIGADSESEAEQVLRGFQLNWSADTRAISVTARHPAETRARFVWRDQNQIEPTFRVTVPHACNLNLKTITGMITVGNVAGRVQAHAETGDVFLRQVTGIVDAGTEFGDLVVSHCVGPLTGRVLRGTIRVGTLLGPCDLKNSSGDVEVMVAKAGGHIYAEAGTVTVAMPRDSIGDLDVRTSGGSILFGVDPAAHAVIEASASLFAHVENRLPLTIEREGSGRRHLVGQLNGGGPRVRLQASGGDVTLRTVETSFD
jgi:hypothetical protein